MIALLIKWREERALCCYQSVLFVNVKREAASVSQVKVRVGISEDEE